MQIFTADDIALMGDMDPQFGQTYYGTVLEQAVPVRFNLKQVVDIAPGRKFTAEEVEHRTSRGSGKPYTQLKKVKLSESPETALPKEAAEPEWFDQPEEAIKPAASLAEAWQETKKAKQVPDTVPASQPDRPEYEAGTNARWAIGMAYRAYLQVMGTPEDAGGDFPFDAVLSHARELLSMFETLIRKEK